MANRKKKKSIFAKVFWQLVGLFLVVFSLSLIISSISYDANDPSFNTVTSRVANNVLGYFGAFWASIILQSFGAALPVFLIAPIIWGYDLMRLREFVFGSSRVFAFILGTLFLSSCLALLPPYFGDFNLGGMMGVFISRHLMYLIDRIYFYDNAPIVVEAVLFAFALLAFNFAAGITYKHWWAAMVQACRAVAKSSKAAWAFLKVMFSKKRSEIRRERKIKERTEPKIKEEKVKEPKEKKAFETISRKAKQTNDGYVYPDINLISKPAGKGGSVLSDKEMDVIARDLEMVLQEFGVNGKIVKVRPGPVVTLYELEPAAGTKTARVIGLADDIARSMSVSSVRIAVVSGSNTIGIEMPNPKRDTVWIRELFEDERFMASKNTLNIVLGKDIGGENVYADLAKMPHLLVAGTTGSGKSVGVNSMILSLLYKLSPDECKFILIDPKMLEFSMYNGIPHLLTPVITDPGKAVVGLKWAVKEMEDRYKAMAQLNVRNILGYNQKLKELKEKGEAVKRTVQTGFDMETGKPIYEEQELDLSPLPYIVVVVDEMADLMLVAGKDVEAAIQRLAQMARAAGIHLIMSTQRPSVDVITGTIKANFPTRISFQVTSKIDSRTILGEQGAEQLLGMGDMLYMPAGQRPIRIHGSFVKDSEVERVVEFLKSQKDPEYIDEVTAGELGDKGAVFDKGEMGSGEDDLYTQALAIVREDRKVSISLIQRKLRIGYNRSATIVDRMETEGVVTRADAMGRREVI